MCRILHGIYISLFSANTELIIFFLRKVIFLCFADKLLKYSLCLLTLLQFRKASITLCDQTDMLKWDHMLILGFRELDSVFVPVPRLFQDTRKHDLILRNSTWSKILSLGHSSDSAFIWGFAYKTTFFNYSTVDATFKGKYMFNRTYSEQSPAWKSNSSEG